jgi:hypothetical protein
MRCQVTLPVVQLQLTYEFTPVGVAEAATEAAAASAINAVEVQSVAAQLHPQARQLSHGAAPMHSRPVASMPAPLRVGAS